MTSAKQSMLVRGFVALALFCLCVLIVVVGKPILAPLALATILAFVLTPIVYMMERWGIPRTPSVIATMSMVVIISLLLAFGLVTQLKQLADDFPRHAREMETKTKGLRELTGSVLNRPWAMADRIMQSIDGEEPESSDSATEDSGEGGVGRGGAPTQTEQLVVVIPERKSSQLIQWVPTVAAQLFEPIAVISLVVVLTAFILLKREDLRNRVLAVLGRTQLSRSTHVLEDASQRLARYLLGLLMVNLGFSIAFTLLLWVIGVPYAALWGAISFFFRFVPLIGSAVSMLAPLTMAFITVPGWFTPLAVIVAYLSLEGFTGNAIEPWVFGKSVGMNPMAVLVALMFWTWAWGLLGLALATPLSLILVTLGQNIPSFSWLHVLMGNSHPLPVSIAFYQRLLAKDTREIDAMMNAMAKKRGATETMQLLILGALRRADREKSSGLISQENYETVIQEAREANQRLAELAATAATAATPSIASKEAVRDEPRIGGHNGHEGQSRWVSVSELEESLDATDPREEADPIEVGAPLRIVTFDFGDERAASALQIMLAGQSGLEVLRLDRWNPSMARRLVADAPDVVLLSHSGAVHKDEAIALARLLRKNGFDGWIVLGWWRAKSLRHATRLQLKEAGIDYITHRLTSMDRMLRYAVRTFPVAAVPENKAAVLSS